MREHIITGLLAWRIEILGPVTGGSLFTILASWAPIIGLGFGFVGVIFGYLTYRLKLKKTRLEMEILRAKFEKN
ncbi:MULTISPECIES: hypothetical protein [unclassified Carboxylicivirga]|uniref:hypothetical protein n=1 Tax=Carboxylicivirga TaxID=1628153 RepID=UPI003D335F13